MAEPYNAHRIAKPSQNTVLAIAKPSHYIDIHIARASQNTVLAIAKPSHYIDIHISRASQNTVLAIAKPSCYRRRYRATDIAIAVNLHVTKIQP
jgi:hypothetical protein